MKQFNKQHNIRHTVSFSTAQNVSMAEQSLCGTKSDIGTPN